MRRATAQIFSNTLALTSLANKIVVQVHDGREKAQELGLFFGWDFDARPEVARTKQVRNGDGCDAHRPVLVGTGGPEYSVFTIERISHRAPSGSLGLPGVLAGDVVAGSHGQRHVAEKRHLPGLGVFGKVLRRDFRAA